MEFADPSLLGAFLTRFDAEVGRVTAENLAGRGSRRAVYRRIT
jgi:hypothetical protein